MEDKCTCEDGHDGHPCPYEVAVEDNDDPDHCDCCPYCTEKCAMEI